MVFVAVCAIWVVGVDVKAARFGSVQSGWAMSTRAKSFGGKDKGKCRNNGRCDCRRQAEECGYCKRGDA